MKKFGLKRFRYHALIGAGLILTYGITDFWWYSSGMTWALSKFGSSPVDPFSVSARGYNQPIANRSIHFLNSRAFVNLKLRYSRLTSPFKPSKDPFGSAYFPSSFPSGYENPNTTFSWSGVMRRFGEPSLYKSPEDLDQRTTIRLTIIPSRDEFFTCRITGTESSKDLANGTLVWVDRETGHEIHRETKEFPAILWKSIQEIIEAPENWVELNELEKVIFSMPECPLWFFELRTESGYQFLLTPFAQPVIPPIDESGTEIIGLRDFRKHFQIGKLIQKISPYPVPGILDHKPSGQENPIGASD